MESFHDTLKFKQNKTICLQNQIVILLPEIDSFVHCLSGKTCIWISLKEHDDGISSDPPFI